MLRTSVHEGLELPSNSGDHLPHSNTERTLARYQHDVQLGSLKWPCGDSFVAIGKCVTDILIGNENLLLK